MSSALLQPRMYSFLRSFYPGAAETLASSNNCPATVMAILNQTKNDRCYPFFCAHLRILAIILGANPKRSLDQLRSFPQHRSHILRKSKQSVHVRNSLSKNRVTHAYVPILQSFLESLSKRHHAEAMLACEEDSSPKSTSSI